MRILLDNCLRKDAVAYFVGHDVRHVSDLGWSNLRNGELLEQAAANYDVFVTVDKNMRFQSNVSKLNLRVAVIDVHGNLPEALEAGIRALLPQLGDLVVGRFTVVTADS